MGFFKNKNKKAVSEPEPVQAPEVVNTPQTQVDLAKTADVREEIAFGFKKLRNSQDKFRKAAQKNQEKLDQYSEDSEAGENENRSRLAEELKELLIDEEKLGVYSKGILTLEALFKNTSSADSVDKGANKLEVFVIGFLDNLYSAMETGQSLKANAAIDLIKYVYQVGFRFIDTEDEEERKRIIDEKVKFLSGTGKGLIELIDKLYATISEYEIDEKKYAETLATYTKLLEDYDRSCPKSVKQQIETLGFKNAMSAFHAGDDRYQYLDMVLTIYTHLTDFLEASMSMEAEMRDIVGLKNDIRTFVYEMEKAFKDTGKRFDDEKRTRILNEIHAKNLRSMREANERAIARFNAEKVLRAKLDEIQSNPRLGESVESAAIGIKNYQYLERQNQRLQEEKERANREYELNKRKELRDKEKRLAEEHELYLKSLQDIENEREEIKENDEAVMQQIETEEIITEQEKYVEPVDNREVIVEEA